ncbi:MAG TPA: hypothetical protein VMH39_15425 [Gemmatimonadaceae bacterium]|nr:hypothetical protein [Gemmatimonadaceae bacterium]
MRCPGWIGIGGTIALLGPAPLVSQVVRPAPAPAESVYASPALQRLVAAAAVANRAVPAALASYRAHLESELAFVIRDSLGREFKSQVEQVASQARWDRGTGYETHVIGYRSETIGVPFSALTIVHGWTLPMLYGDRLLLGIEENGGVNARAVRGLGGARDTILVVHPFASDRDEYYRYSGGDTITVLREPHRDIPVVRIRVSPHFTPGHDFAAFDGEIDIDAVRHQIVRMRGRFVQRVPRVGNGAASVLVAVTGAVGVAYVEFVNEEVDGRYWLPTSQRIEFQAGLAMFGTIRSVFRIVSRFSDYAIDDTSRVSGPDVGLFVRRVTFAGGDSVDDFHAWNTGLGTLSGSVTADDFTDFAPSSWSPVGPPRLTLYPSQFDHVLHFNRVEGLYTGAEGSVDFRDLAPGLSARAFSGWAWTERTVRGGAGISRQTGNWTTGLRAERALVSTNDFPLDLENGDGGLTALLSSIDDNDYVDRSTADVWESHVLGSLDRGIVTAQLGVGRDANEVARLAHGLLSTGTMFLPNRDAAPGRYAHAVVDYEYHPDVSSDFADPGFGGRLHYEAAVGQLAWQRAEVTVSARRYVGPITLSERADAGVVSGATIPPQQLFELGGDERLPGYPYKAFAGDRAALFRVFANYTLPVDRKPHRIGFLVVPGLSPGFGAGVQGGWAQISDSAAARAVTALGAGWSAAPVSQATDGIRATVGAGLTLFSGAMHLVLARPVDHAAPWRWSFGFGQAF